MDKYIGTKIIEAEPANRYELHSGGHFTKKCSEEWTKDEAKIINQPHDVKGGYAVLYPDGYESWSPKDVFEEAYRPTNGMNFGLAIEAAKKGAKVTRRGWNGKGMYVFLADGVEFHTEADLSEYWGNADGVCVLPVLVLRTAKGDLQPGWLASQSDMLSDDWEVVE